MIDVATEKMEKSQQNLADYFSKKHRKRKSPFYSTFVWQQALFMHVCINRDVTIQPSSKVFSQITEMFFDISKIASVAFTSIKSCHVFHTAKKSGGEKI